MSVEVRIGDARARLRELPAESAHCCVTSPPYFGLRDYGVEGQIGAEATPEAYVAALVAVFAAVRRVLRPDGTLWLNLGDAYRAGAKAGPWDEGRRQGLSGTTSDHGWHQQANRRCLPRLKPKDLIGIPWMTAFALRADGWWLRGEQIWAKTRGMPESVVDRPTRAHETVFLLTKSADYYYGDDDVRLPPAPASVSRLEQHVEARLGSARAYGGAGGRPMKAVVRGAGKKQRGHGRRHAGFIARWDAMSRVEQRAGGARLRSVWWLNPAAYADAHFAVMPETLAATCILAGCPPGGTVVDPFAGTGTTGAAAQALGRRAVLIELNPAYEAQMRRRCAQAALPLEETSP